jgi:plastocyanin
MYTPSTTSGNSGSVGTGATHTVIVAPTQGVLRYVPFAVNASVGDTIQFMWNANNHTVTKSSELLPCNKTADSPFTSGQQSKGFVFTQVVNSTDPTYFYCGVPSHCQKGMFGIINPPSALSSSTSIFNSMTTLAANNPDLSAMVSYTNQLTASNNKAANWGNSIDLAKLPDWAHQYVAENTLYTRTFLAANPEVLGANGAVNLGASGGNPIMIPQDITAALNNAAASPSSSGSATPPSSSPAATATGGSSSTSATPSASPSNGASHLASPSVLAVVAIVATFLAL